MRDYTTRRRAALLVGILALAASVSAAADAPSHFTPPKNKFTPAQDVQLGQEAAGEVEKSLPLVKDDEIQAYVDRLGRQLVAVAPPELNKPEYQYSFKVVDQKEINAFALPGGPMFLNRGMIEAAEDEAGVVGVMAHELAHVLLRHGTANITKAQNPWLQIGNVAGILAGAVVGGAAGAAIANGTQFGLGTVLLKNSREFEKQADLLGAELMARAGYDPRALAAMFETISKESGSGGPQWLSDHPNPGNRTQYIGQLADTLEIVDPVTETPEFERVRAKFAKMPPAPTAQEVARRAKAGPAAPVDVGTLGEPVPPPSPDFRTARAGSVFQVDVPANWQAISSNNVIRFVPRNAYGQRDGHTVFTHGVEMGLARSSSRDLQRATRELLDGLASSNPNLRLAGEQQAVRLSQRSALATPLVNTSDETGREERIGLYTTFLANGQLFYYAWVVPADEFEAYRETFTRVGRSIRLTDNP